MAYKAGTLPRKLCAGCYGGLELGFACGRGHSFDEAWLHGLIAEIVGSNRDTRTTDLRKGFAVDALQKLGRGKGRKREVDFALIESATGAMTHCIEAKWAGSGHCTPKTILRDIARLAVISAAHPASLCLFVLAGGKSAVGDLFQKAPLASPANRKHGLLHYPYDGGRSMFPLRVDGNNGSSLTMAQRKELVEYLPTLPRAVQTTLYAPSHVSTPNWQVHVWRVAAL
ncbi:hypothetical protein [Pseudoclavibacter terrae]|uniref:Uncharacterized protein n=1 Tax=Pseudoclavibacter terrae TaxID=1530195 RepID=A0A7J5AXE5_9MICO|nr:hypothetical protein [Pseudoclavibacter terrae]KAB1636123.1 hypothetical protein F8O03_17890 [Pseudoclavibacter terrae]